jgi:hypothetical protein
VVVVQVLISAEDEMNEQLLREAMDSDVDDDDTDSEKENHNHGNDQQTTYVDAQVLYAAPSHFV